MYKWYVHIMGWIVDIFESCLGRCPKMLRNTELLLAMSSSPKCGTWYAQDHRRCSSKYEW